MLSVIGLNKNNPSNLSKVCEALLKQSVNINLNPLFSKQVFAHICIS